MHTDRLSMNLQVQASVPWQPQLFSLNASGFRAKCPSKNPPRHWVGGYHASSQNFPLGCLRISTAEQLKHIQARQPMPPAEGLQRDCLHSGVIKGHPGLDLLFYF